MSERPVPPAALAVLADAWQGDDHTGTAWITRDGEPLDPRVYGPPTGWTPPPPDWELEAAERAERARHHADDDT